MTKILVTGANGFVGFHLVQRLINERHQVTCMVRKTSNTDLLQPLDVQYSYGDILDPESIARAVDGHEIVFHVAGCTRSLRLDDMRQINGQGVENVARACAEQDPSPVLVVVSSLAAAGPAPKGRALREDDPASPISNYGRSKLLGEEAARRFADRVPTTIVRPGIVFGESDRDCLEIFKMIHKTRFHVSPGFRARQVSMIHAEDLALLLLKAAKQGQRLRHEPGNAEQMAEGVYFASCGEDPTYPEFGRMISCALDTKLIAAVRTGPLVIWAIAAVSELKGRLLHRPAILNFDKAKEGLSGPWFCTNEKACRELEFEPKRSLADRLSQTADWYVREGWL